jgi:GGDEF domain-containing protein
MAAKQPGTQTHDPDAIVHEVGLALASSLVLEEVLTTVVRRIAEAMDVWSCAIHGYDEERHTRTCAALWTQKPTKTKSDWVGHVIDLSERPACAAVIDTRQPVEASVDDKTISADERAAMKRSGEKATLEVPLIYGDTVIGALSLVETRHPRHFTHEEKELLLRLAQPAAIAIHNARMFRRQEERARRLTALLGSSRALTATVEHGEVLRTVASEAAAALAVPRSAILVFRPELDALVLETMHERGEQGPVTRDGLDTTYELGECPGERAILEGGVVVQERVSDEELAADRRLAVQAWGVDACLSVPLAFGGRPVGILRLGGFEQERLFSDAELEFIGGLGELAGVAINNARLFRSQREQSERLVGLFETSRRMASSFDAHDVVAHTVRELAALFGGSAAEVEIRLRDGEGQYVPAEIALAEEGEAVDGPADYSQPGELEQRAVTNLVTVRGRENGGLALVVPLVVKARAEGYVAVRTAKLREFAENETEVVQIIANQAAVALENAGLYGRIERLAITDGLTGLYNHRHFYERLHQECACALRYKLPLSLLMIDIDDFKKFNDEYGHPLGDQVLRDLADMLQTNVRRGVDIPARYGGEEFVVILPYTAGNGAVGERRRPPGPEGPTGPPPAGSGAGVVGERIRHDIEEALFPGHGGRRSVHITVSVGVAGFLGQALSADELVRHADKALYTAKHKGKNRLEVSG